MQLTVRYPKHDQGDRTRQRILQAITEDPNLTITELAQKLNVSIDTIRRQTRNLRIAGLLSLAFFIILFPLSGFCTEIETIGGQGGSIEAANQLDEPDAIDQVETDEETGDEDDSDPTESDS